MDVLISSFEVEGKHVVYLCPFIKEFFVHQNLCQEEATTNADRVSSTFEVCHLRKKSHLQIKFKIST